MIEESLKMPNMKITTEDDNNNFSIGYSILKVFGLLTLVLLLGGYTLYETTQAGWNISTSLHFAFYSGVLLWFIYLLYIIYIIRRSYIEDKISKSDTKSKKVVEFKKR